MTLSKTEKRLVWAVVILAVLAIGYDIFLNNSSAPAPAAVSATPVVGQDILALVERLKTISIDPSIFSSAVFSSLKDSETPLAPEVQGRADPFAAIGVDAPFTTTVAEPASSADTTGQNTQGVTQPTTSTATATSTAGM